MFRSVRLPSFTQKRLVVATIVAHERRTCRKDVQDPVHEELVGDNLPMLMESALRSIHHAQPDVEVFSQVRLGVMQYSVAGHTASVGIPLMLGSQRYPRCSSVAGAVVDRLPRELLDKLLGPIIYSEEEGRIEKIGFDIPWCPRCPRRCRHHHAGSGTFCPVEPGKILGRPT